MGSKILSPKAQEKNPEMMKKFPIMVNHKLGGIVGDFKFEPPIEAPLFEPTLDEFENPLKYISSIRHVGEKTGILKIKPPPSWQPPFTVDVDKFKFTPRIQRLNELEAKTRIKLNFLDQIAKFWELQGSCLKIPIVEKKILDLYTLHQLVREEGGFHACASDKKWSKVGQMMGFTGTKGLGILLKNHYERILYPYEIFNSGDALAKLKPQSSDGEENEKGDCDYKLHSIPARQAIKSAPEKYGRWSKRFDSLDNEEGTDEHGNERAEWNENKELRRLQCFGAGPKMAGFQKKPKPKSKGKKTKKDNDPLAKYVCHICGRGDSEECMLLCDGCDDSYHTFCLKPPLESIPKGDWRCPVCVAEEVRKPSEAFGFEQAQREYTLHQFGEMADIFKSQYFNMPVHCVPSSLVEREFWRIVSSIDEDVTVEYGADLHTMDHGSGFPTKSTHPTCAKKDEEYVNSGWNLNNIPILEGSVLGHINADISGMKVPWMYVGMCFAAFCWHNEDHWSYSINYLHWGEPKTWYGVPGYQAELFEGAMKKVAPELFESQPDLLHQLVTIMNPNILMKEGVTVCRTDQQAGEFVITFPRAYHAGFNQGYNFAEAVNFAPADWLKMGRECINHYSSLHRFCVFSHDELVCKMASDPEKLNASIATATYQDMEKMFEEEKVMRKALLEWGISNAEQESFELVPDDERQCEVCKTTCFLSAVVCSCNNERLVCLRHYKELCGCEPQQHQLKYRYTLNELHSMLKKLKVRSEAFEEWVANVEKLFEQRGPKTELSIYKALLEESIKKNFPQDNHVTEIMKKIVSEGEHCAQLADMLLNAKIIRNKPKPKVSLEELRKYVMAIDNLKCSIKDGPAVKEFVNKVENFKKTAETLFKAELPTSKELGTCLAVGADIIIDLPEVPKLKQLYQQMLWLEEVEDKRSDPKEFNVELIQLLLKMGLELPPHSRVEKVMTELQSLVNQVERWEEKAKMNLQGRSLMSLDEIENFLREGADIPAYLPSYSALENQLDKGREWMAKVEAMQSGENYPYFDAVEEQVLRGRRILARLDPLALLEENMNAAKAWKERAARTFLRKNSHYTLMDALAPRTAFGLDGLKMKLRKFKEEGGERRRCTHKIHNTKLEGDVDPATVVAAFKGAEVEEISRMVALRTENERKRAKDSGGDDHYCVCRRGISGIMLQCELCKDLFHAKCMPLSKFNNPKNKVPNSTHQLMSSPVQDHKFLCPCCLKSRRPRLETILSLLVSLQKVPVRIPEGEALQCLTERAMNWQDRSRNLLIHKDVAAVLAKLSVLSQKLVEAAAREKTEKIITSELKKAASNPELHQRVQSISSLRTSAEDHRNPNHDKDQNTDTLESVDEDFGDRIVNKNDEDSTDEVSASSFNNLEHAYSSASKLPALGGKKHVRKTPLVPRQLESPGLRLNSSLQLLMEDLMMEGDLLEVSLDETHHMWRILQAVRPREEHKYPDFEEWDNEEVWYSEDGKEKRRGKKKAPDDPEMAGLTKKIRVRINDDKSTNKRRDMKNRGKQPTKDMPKKVKRLKVKNEEGGSRKRSPRGRTTERSQDTSDDDEDCAAFTCLRPTGHEVDWVQCDGGCEQWFHLHCVGLIKADINEDEDYLCRRCSNSQQKYTEDEEHRSHLSPIKLEIINEDESMGLDALLQLSVGSPDWDSSNPTAAYEDKKNGVGDSAGTNNEMDAHGNASADLIAIDSA